MKIRYLPEALTEYQALRPSRSHPDRGHSAPGVPVRRRTRLAEPIGLAATAATADPAPGPNEHYRFFVRFSYAWRESKKSSWSMSRSESSSGAVIHAPSQRSRGG